MAMQIGKYIPRYLTWIGEDGELNRVRDDQLEQFVQPLVVLGPPGMGKTCLMQELGEKEGMHFVRAATFLRQEGFSPQPAERLVIDGLDEVAAAEEGDPLHNVLKKLARCGKPSFILSCRSADWRGVTAKTDIIDDYGATPLELNLDPLTREQALRALEEEVEKSDAHRSLDALDGADLSGLYTNPLTLGLISSIIRADGEVPQSRAKLYERSVRELRLERNPHHSDADLANLSEEAALDAAGAAMAASLVTGREVLVKGIEQSAEGTLAVAELSSLSEPAMVAAILGSNLFRSEGPQSGRFSPLHRTIAEFLGARWLARQVDNSGHRSRVVSRLLGLISGEGGVPASLRGIHAWLAHFSPTVLGPKVISTDPYGVLRYGNADDLAIEQARLLLNALKKLSVDDPYFRSGDWQEISAKGLDQPELQNEVRQILIAPETSEHFRSMLLEILRGSNLAVLLEGDLLSILRDSNRTFGERSRSADALLELPSDWQAIVSGLIQLGDEDSGQLAVKFLSDVGPEHFDGHIIAEAVIVQTGILGEAADDDRHSYLRPLDLLARKTPVPQIVGVLDTLSARILAIDDLKVLRNNDHWAARAEIATFANRLIVRQLDDHPEDVSAQQLWDWLRALEREDGYHRGDREEISAHFKRKDTLRRGIQQLILFERGSEDKFYSRHYRLTRMSSGLFLQDSDAREFIADISRRKDASDRERWKALVDHLRGDQRANDAIQAIALPYAEGDEELTKYLTSKPKRPPLDDWEKKHRRSQREREKRKEKKRAETRKAYSEHIEEVRLGKFNWILNPAQAYLGMFSDLEREGPPEGRVEEWLGTEIAAAALEGFEAVLHRDDLPTVQKIAESYAQSKVWNFVYPMIAGAGLRMLAARGFADLPDSLLTAIAIAVEYELIEQRQGFDGLLPVLNNELRQRGNVYEAYIRQKFEPHLRENQKHISGLYAFARSADERPLSTQLCTEWLNMFPDLPCETERELVGCLADAPEDQRTDAWEALRNISTNRLASILGEEERRMLWTSIQFLVDFETAIKLVPAITQENRNWLWPLISWFYDDYERPHITPHVAPNRLSWLIRTFREVWPSVERPGGVTVGTQNPWDASKFMQWAMNRLAADSSVMAAKALAELRDMPPDDYSTHLQAAIAQQRRVRLEAHFETPTLGDLKAALNDLPPKTAADVQAIALDALAELQERLRGDSLNPVNNFYDDAGKPRIENSCRDQMLLALGQLPFRIQVPPETAMPQGSRSDAAFAYGDIAVPLETKGQWHKDVWTAAATQLDRLYATDYKAARKGIYVVFWFGPNAPSGKKLKLPPGDMPKPKNPEEMKAGLEALLPSYRRGDIAIVVLDVTRP